MHPSHLHALAALASLDVALVLLRNAQIAEASETAASGDFGTLQAWRPGTGIRVAREHGDVLLDAVIRHVSALVGPYAERGQRTDDTIRWLTAAALGDAHRHDQDPLDQLREHLPAMTPSTAASLARWVDEQDQAVRRLLGEPDDHQLWPGVACPSCDTAGALALRMSGPAEDRVVVCTVVRCLCTGEGCGCRMPVKASGWRHIWTLTAIRATLDS